MPAETIKPPKKRRKRVFAGYDPGKYRDYSAIVFVEPFIDTVLNDSGQPVRRKALRVIFYYNRKSEEHLKVADTLIMLDKNYFHIVKLGIDATGVGDPIYEYLKPHFKDRIVPINWGAGNTKERLYRTLRMFLEGERLVIPYEAEELLVQLRNIEYEFSPRSNRIIFKHPEKVHDDLVSALAMAVWVYQQYVSEIREVPQAEVASASRTPVLAFRGVASKLLRRKTKKKRSNKEKGRKGGIMGVVRSWLSKRR